MRRLSSVTSCSSIRASSISGGKPGVAAEAGVTGEVELAAGRGRAARAAVAAAGAGFLATVTRELDLGFACDFAGAFDPAELLAAGRTRTGATGTFLETFFTDDFAASFLDIAQPSPRSWQVISSEQSEPG